MQFCCLKDNRLAISQLFRFLTVTRNLADECCDGSDIELDFQKC